MIQYGKRLLKLVAGLAVSALGIVMTVQANIGTEPWSVLHQGISNVTGITFGTASVVVGVGIILIASFLGEQIGLGTILNILLTGILLDGILATGLIHQQHSFWPGLAMLVAGLELIALGTWLYMSSGLGSGPRDALTVGLAKHVHHSVGVCRSSMEILAIVVGGLTGGQVGIGTVVSAVGIGFLFEVNFKLLHFVPTALHQESLKETAQTLLKKTKQHQKQ